MRPVFYNNSSDIQNKMLLMSPATINKQLLNCNN